MSQSSTLLELLASRVEARDLQQTFPFFTAPREALKHIGEDPLVWDRIMRRMQVPLGESAKPLGTGGHGIVFQIGDRALKLTDDPVEASAAVILKKRPMAEAYHVFDVFSVMLPTDLIRSPEGKRYCIVTEVLVPPAANWKRLVGYWERWARGEVVLTPDNVQDFLAEATDNDITFNRDAMEWLMRAAKNLTDRKILNRDLHLSNLMARPSGEQVLIDFGHFSVVPQKRIPTAQTLDWPKPAC